MQLLDRERVVVPAAGGPGDVQARERVDVDQAGVHRVLEHAAGDLGSARVLAGEGDRPEPVNVGERDAAELIDERAQPLGVGVDGALGPGPTTGRS